MSFARKLVPDGIPLTRLLLGFWVPGYSYFLFGAAWVAWLIIGGWFLGLATYIMLLNAPPFVGGGFQIDPAYLAFGLMISLHATSASHLIVQIWHYEEFRERLLVGITVTGFMIFLVYFPAADFIHSRMFTVVSVGGSRVVVNPRVSAESVRRGDVVFYQIPAYNSGQLHVREGAGLGKVLGVQGDMIRFEGKYFYVNGIRQLSRSEMPQTGEVAVPKDHWFIWPEFNTMMHGNLEGQRQEAFMHLAMVGRMQFEGRPYSWWLFGKQLLP